MKFYFEEMQGGFLTELTYNTQKTTINKSSDKSSDKILLLLSENSQITISELSQKLNISTRAIEKNSSNLKTTNKIRRIGSKKAGYWEIIN